MAQQQVPKPSNYPERVALFGSEGGFSRPVLTRLLAHNVNVATIVMPGVTSTDDAERKIPVTMNQTIDRAGLAGLAVTHGIPVLRTQDIQAQWLFDELSSLAIDIILVSCFPLKLPKTLWQLPAVACWNLHPSLLPRYRGPTPLYWQLRNHEQHTGVSLHEVIDQLDAGNIVAQQECSFPDNKTAANLNDWVAGIGVTLFLEAIDRYRRDCLITRRQDETAASYFPHPDTAGVT